MIKKLLILTTAALAVSSLTAQAELKVAVIDLQKVFEDYYKTKEADSRLKDQMEGFKTTRDERLADYRKLVDQIKSLRESVEDPSLSEEARKDKELKYQEKFNEARQREQELRSYEQTTAKLLQDQSGRMRQTIVEEINTTVEEFCAGKYDLVIDKTGNTVSGTPVILYSENLTDLTTEIVKILNSKQGTE